MNLRFWQGIKEKLNTFPLVPGNIYLTKDTYELFYDDVEERKQWFPDLSCILFEVEQELNYPIEEEEEIL